MGFFLYRKKFLNLWLLREGILMPGTCEATGVAESKKTN